MKSTESKSSLRTDGIPRRQQQRLVVGDHQSNRIMLANPQHDDRFGHSQSIRISVLCLRSCNLSAQAHFTAFPHLSW